MALLCHKATKIWVNFGSGNGLLPDGTKPLPEPMLTPHQLCLSRIHLSAISQEIPQPSITKIGFINYSYKISFKPVRGQWVNLTLVMLEMEYSDFGVNTIPADALALKVTWASASMVLAICRTDNICCCSRVSFIYLVEAKSNKQFKM